MMPFVAYPSLDQGEKKLPPCSEYFASGQVDVTLQAFISAPSIDNPIPDGLPFGGGTFHGDGRGPLNSPADGVNDTFRFSNTISMNLESGDISRDRRIGTSVWNRSDGSTQVAVQRDTRIGSFGGSMGDERYLISHAGAAGVPFIPGSNAIAPIVGTSWLTLDTNTGTISGSLSHTPFPSFQLFVNGQPIYYGQESDNPGDIRNGRVKADVNQQLCDPSR